MIIKNPSLWKEFQQPGLCNMCKRPCMLREPHHMLSRTPELTVRINLLAVGSSAWHVVEGCECHMDIHAGKIPRNQVLELIADRKSTRLNASH